MSVCCCLQVPTPVPVPTPRDVSEALKQRPLDVFDQSIVGSAALIRLDQQNVCSQPSNFAKAVGLQPSNSQPLLRASPEPSFVCGCFLCAVANAGAS
jgi:hypothetical protein